MDVFRFFPLPILGCSVKVIKKENILGFDPPDIESGIWFYLVFPFLFLWYKFVFGKGFLKWQKCHMVAS